MKWIYQYGLIRNEKGQIIADFTIEDATKKPVSAAMKDNIAQSIVNAHNNAEEATPKPDFKSIPQEFEPIFCSICGNRIGWLDTDHSSQGIYRCDSCINK